MEALDSKTVNKAFSQDIIPRVVDEDTIGILYEKLDLILLALEKSWDNDPIVVTSFNPLTIDRKRHIIPTMATGQFLATKMN